MRPPLLPLSFPPSFSVLPSLPVAPPQLRLMDGSAFTCLLLASAAGLRRELVFMRGACTDSMIKPDVPLQGCALLWCSLMSISGRTFLLDQASVRSGPDHSENGLCAERTLRCTLPYIKCMISAVFDLTQNAQEPLLYLYFLITERTLFFLMEWLKKSSPVASQRLRVFHHRLCIIP